MKIGASTFYGLLGKSALQVSEELYRNGIDTVELVWEYKHNQTSEEEIRGMRKIGIDYSLHLPFSCVSFAHIDPEIRKPQINNVEKALKAAEKLGATHCVMHGGFIPGYYMDIDSALTKKYFYDTFVSGFEKIFKKADDAGVKIVLENLSKSDEIFGNYEDIVYVKKLLPFTGFCLDIPHGFRRDNLELYMNMQIDHVHVTDSKIGGDDHLGIGRGELPIKEVLGRLKKKGYNGKVIFEGLRFADTLESVRKLREMMK